MWSVKGIRELLRFARKHDGPWEYECGEYESMPDERDAPVIAAAVELLDALESMVEMVEMSRSPKYAMNLAKAAIAKARKN